MSQHIDAIYENGVLKPLQPLSLPEHAQVKVIVNTELSQDSEARAKAQQIARQKMFREVDAIPQAENRDGWSAANHDDLLYGGDQ